jgi:hypothetical protein
MIRLNDEDCEQKLDEQLASIVTRAVTTKLIMPIAAVEVARLLSRGVVNVQGALAVLDAKPRPRRMLR